MSDNPGNGFHSNPELDGSWGGPAPEAWPEDPGQRPAQPADYNATVGYNTICAQKSAAVCVIGACGKAHEQRKNTKKFRCLGTFGGTHDGHL